MKRTLIFLFSLTFLLILGNSIFSKSVTEVSAVISNPSCQTSEDGSPICAVFDLRPDFCLDGTIVKGDLDDCGCESAPTCDINSSCPTIDGSPVCGVLDLGPDFCLDGTIVKGDLDDCGCEGFPTCEQNNIICTQEAKQCPDGSFVGRSGNDCQFDPCPIVITPPPGEYCLRNSDCSSDEFCYQPPMPECPVGMVCTLALPQSYCKTKETITNNKVSFITPYVKLTADNFYIEAKGKKFLAQKKVKVWSNPGTDSYTTLNTRWFENKVEMRMKLFFSYTPGDFWKVTKIMTYKGNEKGSWTTFDGFTGHEIGNEMVASVLDLTSRDGNTKIHFENIHLEPFLTIDHEPPSEHGYYIEKKPANDIDAVYAGPFSGWLVNAVLRDKDNNVITDQSPFTYVWTSLNPELLTVTPRSTYFGNEIRQSGCLYDVQLPCPMAQASIAFSGIGSGKIKVQILNDQNEEIATEEYGINVSRRSADLNGDGKVNILDYSILSSQFMATDYPIGDINADGKVNLLDFSIMMSEFKII